MSEPTLFDFEFSELAKEMDQFLEKEQLPSTPVFEVGHLVKVRQPSELDDCEMFYYLSDYQKKKGKIVEVGEKYKPVAYFVDFGNGVAIFNEGELILIA
ncbi:hypothetical protein AWH56_009095 [Anaerobacillus isosaccharinicus]|uniref:Uncharacterized protein n=1 Tax=Anaerobacillus isosaccharinicus TaxID=1532552 RepID=A0A1S2LYA9_9BACI|nr:hypothetical protein [Anaerobacillus isosaccharinicus]MBA5588908.1 hypothetical protein [Anaerobacillus isosaccharinicus]QOY37718.1 hypothetical protein AWH56_009095 [Anaerobacillus isosaccharinicus]